MNRRTLSGVAAALALALISAPGLLAEGTGAPTVSLQPSTIDMGTFYGGARLSINGTVSAGSQVVVAVRGPVTEEVFNRKGRMGPIWINVGKVHISGVPSLFLCFSSGPLGKVLSREALDQNQLDEGAIKAQMVVEPKAMDEEVIRANYLSLKSGQGILKVTEEAVKLGHSSGAQETPFSLDLAWPKRAMPATYEVIAYECREGAVTGRASVQLVVREMGFPETLARLAKDRAYLYGALCVLLAMIAGFGIDFIVSKFGKRGLAGH